MSDDDDQRAESGDHHDFPVPPDQAHDWTADEEHDASDWELAERRFDAGAAAWDDLEQRDLGPLDLPLSEELHTDLERTRGHTRAIAIGLVLAMVLASAGIASALLFLGDDGPGSADGLPGVPPPVGPAPGEAGYDEVLAQLEAFVQDQRGLRFLEPVNIRLAEGEEFDNLLLEDFAESEEDLVLAGRLLSAVGLVEPGTSVVDRFRDSLTAGVVGFYDPEEDFLVVRGKQLTPHVRVTLVHELDHALQDQHFELHRPELDDADDESSLGFSALVEGDAVRVDEAYRATLSPEEQAQAAAEELTVANAEALLSVPPVILQLLVFPYRQGPALVSSLLQAGGQPALDRAFSEPPTTSEQILHPDRFLRGEDRIEVTPPVPEGDVIDQGVFGALALALLIGDGAATAEAVAAVDGWGGDWYVAWARGDQTCVRTRVVVDRPDTLGALVAGLERWQDRKGGNVEAEDSGDAVLFTRCG